METQWWYADGNERFGPVGEEGLNRLVETGVVTAETLVWREGLDNWVSAKAAGVVDCSVVVEPPELLVTPTPARRFFARMVDMFLASFLTFSPLFFLIWIPVEALFLSTWGYTPGKWFFGVKLRDGEGKKLSFDTAIHRAFLVWLKGLCLGIWIGWLVSCPIAYRKLKYEGRTSWDRDLNLLVEQEKVPTGRKIFFVLLMLLYLFLGVMAVALLLSEVGGV